MEFKCDCKCLPEDDNSLHLIVKETGIREFEIKPDGSLEFYDADSNGQEIYLQCSMCGQKYEFDNLELQVEDVPRLTKTVYGDRYSLKVIIPEPEELTFKKM